MHKILLSLLFSIAANMYLSAHSHTTIYSLNEAMSVLNEADTNTLVICDIDETLTVADEPLLRKRWTMAEPIKEAFNDAILHLFNQHKETQKNPLDFPTFKEILWTKIWTQAHLQKVDTNGPSIIHRLQSKNVPIIALSSAFAGIVGTDKSIKEIRFEQLQNIDINLDQKKFPETIIFSGFPVFYGTQPTFYRGILLTNNQVSKGQLLTAFLDYIHWQPTHIIFFDDIEKNLDSVVDAATKRGIRCTTFLHLGTTHAELALDEKNTLFTIKKQLEQLDSLGHLPPYAEIAQYLSNNNENSNIAAEKFL